MEKSLPIITQDVSVSYTGKDLSQVALSPSGSHLALAGKQGYYIVDLNDPWELKNQFNLNTRPIFLDCTTLQFNKDSSLIATVANDTVQVWNQFNDRWSVQKTIKTQHKRKISDMCWSETDYGFFCTCAQDNNIFVWDVRSAAVENIGVQRIKVLESASHVRWNRHDATKIASTHHGKVNIWDLRKVTIPVVQIIAELQEITSLDWSYHDKDVFLTSTFSNKFKIWSIASSKGETIGR